MLNFTVGPVMSDDKVLAIGGEQVPYFRTPEFSGLMIENEYYIKKFAKANDDYRTIFITGAGTASMEAAVINTLTPNDKVLVVNGGGFGARFVEILSLHRIPYTEIKVEFGCDITEAQLYQFEGKNYTAFVVNVHETSTGVHYNINAISDFCKRNNLFLIVDAISSFLADDLDTATLGVDIMIAGSQKALACPPGVSIILLSPRALERIEETPIKSFYLDLKSALKNAERGQTPFTCAVSILRQINVRLKEIETNGGVDNEIERVATIANDFRNKIKELPFEIISHSLSNCVTPLRPTTASANDIFTILKDNYQIWICPNGGEYKDTLFRVGHIGALTIKDNDVLISAFRDLQQNSII